MKFRSMQSLAVMSLVAGATRVATAAEPASPWSLSISGGDSIGESGALRSPISTTFSDLGTLDPALSGSSGTLRLDKLRYEDVFRRRFDTGLELDYSFNDNLQSYGRFGYTSLGAHESTIGALESTAIGSPEAVRAHFAEANNMSFELGSRYLWMTGTAWKPFAGFSLGATHLDAMTATLSAPDLTTDLNDLRFTRGGTVFSQSLQTGVDYTPNEAFDLRFAIDADHFGKPSNGDDPRLTSLGFGPNDDARSFWSFPVSVAAAFHF
jgi:hypothetical protein